MDGDDVAVDELVDALGHLDECVGLREGAEMPTVRHGDRAVLGGKPFKNPVLMADSFAILTPAIFEPSARITGRGIGGVSKAIGTAVHQGYAPVFGVQWEETQ